MLIRNAAISPKIIRDVRIGRVGFIAELGVSLCRYSDELEIDAGGNALIPGLHDHHIHLLALAAAKQSVDCDSERITSSAALESVLKEVIADGVRELRGIGYYEHGGPLIDRYWLDRLSETIPIRIQHRTGRLWILNSCALSHLENKETPKGAERDAAGRLTGRFYHLDDWLRSHLPHSPPAIKPVSDLLASYGVTGITDTGPENDDSVLDILIAAQRNRDLHQNVLLMGNEFLSPYRSDTITTGHCKLYLKESDLPELDAFIQKIRTIHSQNRRVAIHCVTRVELQFALTSFAEAGVLRGDRIEHASIADNGAIAQIAALNLTVVTQPHFVAERGEQYLRYVDRQEHEFLYRAKSFLDGGVALAAGSDAPYGGSNPWAVMRAATERKTAGGSIMMPMEVLTPRQSLSLFTGDCLSPGVVQRKIEVGKSADLCLLAVPWREMLQYFDSDFVRATWCRGEVVFGSVDA